MQLPLPIIQPKAQYKSLQHLIQFYSIPSNTSFKQNLVRYLDVYKMIEQDLYKKQKFNPDSYLGQDSLNYNGNQKDMIDLSNHKKCMEFFKEIIQSFNSMMVNQSNINNRQQENIVIAKLQQSFSSTNINNSIITQQLKQPTLSTTTCIQQSILSHISSFLQQYLQQFYIFLSSSKHNFSYKPLNILTRRSLKFFFIFYTIIFEQSTNYEDKKSLQSIFIIDYVKLFVFMYKKGFRKNITILQIILEIWRIQNVIKQMKNLIKNNHILSQNDENQNQNHKLQINIKIEDIIDKNAIKTMKYAAIIQGQIIDDKNIQKQYIKKKQKLIQMQKIKRKINQKIKQKAKNNNKIIKDSQKNKTKTEINDKLSKKQQIQDKKILKNQQNIKIQQKKNYLPIVIPEQTKIKNKMIKIQ